MLMPWVPNLLASDCGADKAESARQQTCPLATVHFSTMTQHTHEVCAESAPGQPIKLAPISMLLQSQVLSWRSSLARTLASVQIKL